jgi:hypothetical protein
MARHRRGEVKFTSSRLPFEVLTVIALPDKYKALKLEDYLKTGSGRAFALKHFFKKTFQPPGPPFTGEKPAASPTVLSFPHFRKLP